MRLHRALVLLLGFALMGLGGCANARYVETGQGSGVVAMPANTNTWPFYYRDHAEKLMREKCPNGYEIVHENEAVTGQVAHTNSQTETHGAPTLNIGGSEHDKGSSSFAGLAIPVGPTEERTRATTTTQDVTEWRIYYKAK